MSGKNFSAEDNEMLISEISKYAQLYDHQEKDYKNLEIRENIWKMISKTLKKDTELSKNRWKNIRDNYLKHRRKKWGTGSSTDDKSVKWPLFKLLNFLDLVSHERRSIINTEGNANISVYESGNAENNAGYVPDDESSLTSHQSDYISDSEASVSKKSKTETANSAVSKSTPCSNRSARKEKILVNLEERSKERFELLKNLASRPEKEEDEVDLFMRSIAMTVKKMSPAKIAQAKIGILQLVTNLQLSPEIVSSSNASFGNNPANDMRPRSVIPVMPEFSTYFDLS